MPLRWKETARPVPIFWYWQVKNAPCQNSQNHFSPPLQKRGGGSSLRASRHSTRIRDPFWLFVRRCFLPLTDIQTIKIASRKKAARRGLQIIIHPLVTEICPSNYLLKKKSASLASFLSYIGKPSGKGGSRKTGKKIMKNRQKACAQKAQTKKAKTNKLTAKKSSAKTSAKKLPGLPEKNIMEKAQEAANFNRRSRANDQIACRIVRLGRFRPLFCKIVTGLSPVIVAISIICPVKWAGKTAPKKSFLFIWQWRNEQEKYKAILSVGATLSPDCT